MIMLFLSTPSETPGVPHWTAAIESNRLQEVVDQMLAENDELVLEIKTFAD